jgi:hypothetical protein
VTPKLAHFLIGMLIAALLIAGSERATAAHGDPFQLYQAGMLK